jgi:hypothetical protein
VGDHVSEVIAFTAQVIKVQTMAHDNAIRVTMDLNEGNTVTMAKLAECVRFGTEMQVTVKPAR